MERKQIEEQLTALRACADEHQVVIDTAKERLNTARRALMQGNGGRGELASTQANFNGALRGLQEICQEIERLEVELRGALHSE